MGPFGKKKKANPVESHGLEASPVRAANSVETDRTLTHHGNEMSKTQLKRATRTRKIWSLLSAFFLVLSVIFLILVEVGNTKVGKIRSDIYFIRLDLSQIVPSSVPAGSFSNTIAQTLGLHDYYQVGLWNYCEGYKGLGITECSPTKTLYWFNPVAILLSQLLAGATSTFSITRMQKYITNATKSPCPRKSQPPFTSLRRPHNGCLVSSSQGPVSTSS